jgi:streptomycin 6-kinase
MYRVNNALAENCQHGLDILRQVHREVFDTINRGWNVINPQGVIDVRPSFQTLQIAG